MSAVLAQGIPIALLVAALIPGVQQLLRPVHPGRLLAEALSSGFLLLVVGTLLGLPGHWSLLWWAALAVALAGVAAGTARALRVTGPAPALRAARDARALRPATAAPTVAAGEGEAGPRPDGTAPAHPPEHDAAPLPARMRPPGIGVLVVNALLWAGMLAAALLAG